MKRTISILFSFAAIFCHQSGVGQDWHDAHFHFTVENGLSSNYVYNVYKDNKGYMWFCTDNGLVKYNGYEFKYFSVSDGLPDKNILFVREDYYNRLWVSTLNGSLAFIRNDTVYSSLNHPDLKQIKFKKRGFIQTISNETDSTLLIWNNSQEELIHIKDETFKIINYGILSTVTPDQSLVHVEKINDRLYKFYYRDRMILFYPDSTYVLKYYSQNDHYLFSYTHSPNEKYLLAQKGIYDLNESLVFPFDPLQEKNNFYNSVNKFENTFLTCFNMGYRSNNIIYNEGFPISNVIEDNAGNYWMSALEKGCLFRSNIPQLKLLFRNPETQVLNCFQFGQEYYLETMVGNDKRIWCLYDGKTEIKKKMPDIVEKILGNRLPYILDKGITYTLDKNRMEIILSDKQIASREFPQLKNRTKYIFKSRDHIYFIAKNEIYYSKLIIDDQKIHIQQPVKLDFNYYDRILDVVQYEGQIYLATTIGTFFIAADHHLVSIDSNNVFKKIIVTPDCLTGITENNILISQSLSTKESWSRSFEQNGIQDLQMIHPLLFIISTKDQFFLVKKTGHTPDLKLIPLIPNTYSEGIIETVTTDSNFMLITNRQVYKFHMNSLPSDPQDELQLHILRILYDKKEIDTIREPIEVNGSNKNELRIMVDVINFQSREDTRIYYKMENDGYNKTDSSNSKELAISNIPYGITRLQIYAETNSGLRSEVRNITLNRRKPIWLHTWFIVLLSGLAAFLASLMIFWQIRKRERNKMKERTYQIAELRSLNALMNPHFTFNALNNIQSLVNNNEPEKASRYLQVFSKLLRQNLRNQQLIMISLHREIQLVQNYLDIEKLRLGEIFSYKIHYKDESLRDILIPPLLIQPIVENCIKHGYDPSLNENFHIRISIWEENGRVYISIFDNGVGIDQELLTKNSESYSILNLTSRTRQFEKIYNQAIELSINSSNSGKTFTEVILIIDQDH